MLRRMLSTLRKDPISITDNAWNKMKVVLQDKNYAFLFSAKGGGCNGFNYTLNTIDEKEFHELSLEKVPPTIIKNNNTKLIIESSSLWLLIGTNIDYIKEDYSKNIFESKFIFTPKKELATTCGCGVSFTPKNLD